jgi:hypothetical protein
MKRRIPIALVLLTAALVGVAGCKSADATPAASPCKEGVEGDVEVAAKTGVHGAKTGVETGIEGVKSAGDATVGLVEGGSDEAKARWKAGKVKTKQTAHEGGAETKREANTPKCR